MSKLEHICQQAQEDTDNVELQIQAAYACDREGAEARAVVFYDRAWALGVPEDTRAQFVVCYGSTLRNVGRLEDAIKLLSDHIQQAPAYMPSRIFHALALFDQGSFEQAAYTLLEGLNQPKHQALHDGFDVAIDHYVKELAERLESSVTPHQ